MLGAELLVALQVEIGLMRGAERQNVAELRPDAEDARLEASNPIAGAAVAGELLVGVADQAELHLLGEELRRAPIQMRVDSVLVLRVGIFEIVGEAEHRREFPAGLRIEISVAPTGVDRIVSDAEIGEAGRIVSADGDIGCDISHVVMNAVIPAQIELRSEVPKPVDLIGAAARNRKARAAQAQVARESAV